MYKMCLFLRHFCVIFASFLRHFYVIFFQFYHPILNARKGTVAKLLDDNFGLLEAGKASFTRTVEKRIRFFASVRFF
jgi:hypothetical protein